MNKPLLHTLGLIAALGFASPAVLADHGSHGTGHSHAAPVAGAAVEATEGEIRKIDLAGKKLTIKHGELKNLDMPAMTMVFRVSDEAMLEGRKIGEKIHFKAEKRGSGFIVTELMAH